MDHLRAVDQSYSCRNDEKVKYVAYHAARLHQPHVPIKTQECSSLYAELVISMHGPRRYFQIKAGTT